MIWHFYRSFNKEKVELKLPEGLEVIWIALLISPLIYHRTSTQLSHCYHKYNFPVQVEDITFLSVWCRAYESNFGHVKLEHSWYLEDAILTIE